MSAPSVSQFSADGLWWWNGERWMPAVSADGLWRWDGHSWQPTAARQAPVGGQRALHLSDISQVRELRQRLGHASFAMKVIGFLSAVDVLVYSSASVGALSVVLGLTTFGLAYWLSNRLRTGHEGAMLILVPWILVYAVFELVVGLPPALRDFSTGQFYNILFPSIGFAIFMVPVYFSLRGVVAYYQYRHLLREPRSPFAPLTHEPWERKARKPRFLNKRSFIAYVFLILIPVVWGYGELAGLARRDPTSVSDPAEQAGYFLAVTAFGVGLWYLMVFWYRSARRYAMLSGARVTERDRRGLVLYLRSFRDDGIKLWARATDGRIILEKLIKVTFEELLTDHLWRHGPVEAFGNPRLSSQLSPVGAPRDYLPDAMWQQEIMALMRKAAMIVAVVGDTDSFLWEMETIAGLGLLHKLVLVIPPIPPGLALERWRRLAQAVPVLRLPQDIDVRARAVVLPDDLVVVVTGADQKDWTYETVLDDAVALMRSGSEPAGEQQVEAGSPLH